MTHEVCPVCHGSGDDPDGCGCQCFTEEQEANCDRLKCKFCMCEGCGGSCCYCGGSGKKKDWKPGGPYEYDYVKVDKRLEII
jgi:hypothetical protein